MLEPGDGFKGGMEGADIEDSGNPGGPVVAGRVEPDGSTSTTVVVGK